MSLSDFSGPFIIAVMVHALAFSSGSMNHDVTIVPQKSASSVTLNMVTSAARGARTIESDDVPEVPVRNSMTGKHKEPVPAVSELLQAPSENKIPTPIAANTPAPQANIAPWHEERVLVEENSAQQEDRQTGGIAENAEGDTEKYLLRESSPAGERGDLETGDNDADVPERGERIPAAAVGLSKPEYPRFSRIHGEEGTVVLSVKILADGKSGKIEIVSSSGFRRLDKAAVKAMGEARFIAARIDGRNIDSTKRIAFRFDLDD